MYTIEIKLQNGSRWKLEKRFSDFHNMYDKLKLATSVSVSFPPKKWFNNLDLKIVEKRREDLEKFLQAILTLPVYPQALKVFIQLNKNIEKKIEKKESLSPTTALALRKVTVDDFELLKVLGKGSFGKVFLVRLLANKKVG